MLRSHSDKEPPVREMTIAAASIGPNPPITMRTMPSVPPARWESRKNGHEKAYANAKNQISGWRSIRVSGWLVEVEFMASRLPPDELAVLVLGGRGLVEPNLRAGGDMAVLRPVPTATLSLAGARWALCGETTPSADPPRDQLPWPNLWHAGHALGVLPSLLMIRGTYA